jgi:5-methylcytosine-specific restriction endonuclease McrA
VPIRKICICTGCSACPPGKRSHTYDRDTSPTNRCAPCQAIATRQQNARPSSSKRGLGWNWTRHKQQDAGYQSATHCQCTGCGYCGSQGCGQPFTRDNPKTGEHVTPRSRGGTRTPASIPALCLRCNSSKGGALRKGAPYTTPVHTVAEPEAVAINYDDLPFA